MTSKEFIKRALAAGFPPEQADFLNSHVAKYPHVHDMDEVTGLEEALDELSEPEDEEPEEEEDEESV